MNPLYLNIKNRRRELKMTQQELAEKSGYGDRSSIAKLESGCVDLPQSKLELIARALYTTPEALRGTVEVSLDLPQTVEDQDFYRVYAALTPAQRKKLYSMATKLLAQKD